jgi:hypothetical protein
MSGLWTLLHSPPGIVAEILVGLAAAWWKAADIADDDAPIVGRVAVAAVVGTLGFLATTTAVIALAVALGEVTGWA